MPENRFHAMVAKEFNEKSGRITLKNSDEKNPHVTILYEQITFEKLIRTKQIYAKMTIRNTFYLFCILWPFVDKIDLKKVTVLKC